MITYKGTAVSAGIAQGKLLYIDAPIQADTFEQVQICDADAEINKLIAACNKAVDQLMELYDKALENSGAEAADIFMVHSMMLQEEDYLQNMQDLIHSKKCCAEYAILQVAKQFAADLAASGSAYIAERGSDVADVSKRVIQILQGKPTDITIDKNESVILVADELSPSQTLMFDRSKLLALISRKGSRTAHTAILARALSIPAVIVPDLVLNEELTGTLCIVDGLEGTVTISPDEQTAQTALMKQERYLKERQELEILKHKEAVTSTGQKVKIYGNAGNLEDIDAVISSGGEGVGLFRSEFLYLGRADLPSEDELTQVYTNAAKKLDGRLLVIRTLDIGADKTAPCLPLEPEQNPALGIRALRLCFECPEVFMTQLRAILRAAVVGNVAVMFPMIIALDEIQYAKECMKKAAEQLETEKIPYSMPKEIGIMIETPAAAIISDILAKEVDFFSIGSNDLTQYTLAIDRQNQRLEKYCDVHHEAVLRLIEIVAENAHKNNIWVGICGELGSDLGLTERFVKAGIDELSVYPAAILPLKKKIRDL